MSSSDVEQIKEKLGIVDVISSYIKVDKAGINYKARCPFHNEKTPSFFISPTRQSFYCFGCGEKGDIFSFVEKFEGLDFRGALEALADRAGVKLEKFKDENPAETNKKKEAKEKMFEIMEEATEFFEKGLKQSKSSLQYLEKRGLSKDSIKKWRIGFAQDEWRSLHDYLTQKGFGREEMLAVGLVKKALGTGNDQVAKYYDTFRNRIMFPIFDQTGNVIAFSGRALEENDKTPKYLNSPETKLFYKSEVLYGFNVAKNHIRKMDYAVLVEGQMDLLMSQQINVLNTVASSGTALTELHLRKIQKLSNRVIIGYDSDLAGEKASVRAASLALEMGMEVKIASLPAGEDPASIIKNDPEKWKVALKKSEHFTDFVLIKAVEKYEGRSLTKEILKNILPLANLIKSDVEKSQFIKKIALKLKVKEEDVWGDLKKIPAQNRGIDQNFGFEKKQEDQRDPKEALIFEAERYGLKIDVEKTNAEILRRSKLRELKQKLQEITIELDDKDLSKEEEKKVKAEFEEIQKQIKEINY